MNPCMDLPAEKDKGEVEYPQLDEEEQKLEEQRIRDAFNIYDKNKDGIIQRGELADVLEVFLGHKPTPHQLDNIFKKVDSNLDGVIDFPEFEGMMLMRKRNTKRYIGLFNQYDQNGDGFISKEELLKTLNSAEASNYTDEEVDEIIKAADLDKDGMIDYKEFVNYFI